MAERQIYITERDMENLRTLIDMTDRRAGKNRQYVEGLERELDRARIVDSKDVPPDVITMHSRVRLRDLDSGEETIYVLVFPSKADIAKNAISVLAPVGTALIGYREGDTIIWDVPAGTRRLKVLEVLYQPERVGNNHL